MPKTRPARLNYAPLGPAHEAFHNADDYVRIAIGGVDSGKSYMACAEMLSQLLQNPKGRGKTGLVVARTYTHAKNQLVPIFKKILSHQDSRGRQLGFIEGRHYRVTYTPGITIHLPYGSRIMFWSVEAGESVKGLNVTYAVVDEITDMAEEAYNDTFDRTGREGTPGRLWATGNPKHKGHWVYKRFFEEFDKNGEVNVPGAAAYCQYLTTFDNPHTQEKRLAYEQTYGYSALERQRKLEGRFVNLEGLCLPAWDSEKHVFDRKTQAIGKDWHHYVGQDSGYRDATAILRIAKDPEDRFWVYAEYYKSQADLADHVGFIKRPNFPGEHVLKVFADPSAAQNIHEYKNLGVANIEPVSKPPGSILAGIALLNQLLQDGRLFISSDCVHLIREIETYEWASRSAKEQPKPGYGDHAIDALRYVVLALSQTSKMAAIGSTQKPQAIVKDERPVFAYDAKGRPIYLA